MTQRRKPNIVSAALSAAAIVWAGSRDQIWWLRWPDPPRSPAVNLSRDTPRFAAKAACTAS